MFQSWWTYSLCIILSVIVNALSDLSDASIKAIPDPKDDFDIKNGALLAPILQPRVPGTPGSTAVLNHLADFFRAELPTWNLAFQNSTAKVPPDGRDVPFINIIATRDPPGTKPGEVGYLTLVAHYDSLSKPEGFIGAIDSAASCAMLMQIARSLEPALTRKWGGVDSADIDDMEGKKGIQIIFLDGEEAFVNWSDNDSIYGARSLAEHMEGSIHPALSTYHNALSSISLFVLLDLLGSATPNVPSYFPTTHWAYRRLSTLARRISSLTKSQSATDLRAWFPDHDKTSNYWLGGQIGDDHTPFQARGVDILHVIPYPFPNGIWHTMADDGEHLDIPTCKDWAVLMTAFAAEWMDTEGFWTGDENLSGRERIISRTEL